MATWSEAKQAWKLTPAEARLRSSGRGSEPVALHVEVDARGRLVTLYMSDEVDLCFLAVLVPGLRSRPVAAIRAASLSADGRRLAWPELEIELSVPVLVVAGPGRAIAPPEAPPETPPKAPRAARQPAPQPKRRAPRPLPPDDAPGAFPAIATRTGVVVLHGTWVPEPTDAFGRAGAFHLWAEAAGPRVEQLVGAELATLLAGLVAGAGLAQATTTWLLPAAAGAPLPSPEAARWLDVVVEEPAELAAYTLLTMTVADPLQTLAALRFAVLQRPEEVQLGADLAFWCRFAHAVKGAIARDQYIPALRRAAGAGKQASPRLLPTWEFVSASLEGEIARLAAEMPAVCRAAGSAAGLWAAEPLLRQMAAVTLHRALVSLALPASFTQRLAGTLVAASLLPHEPPLAEGDYLAWRAWRDRLTSAHTAPAFDLAFQLEEPEEETGAWALHFLAISRKDPSLRVMLGSYWDEKPAARKGLRLGDSFEREVLLLLGQAARMVPLLSRGLETDRPAGLELSLSEAHAFLVADAWLLEDAGYRVLVPAWWTPGGRKRVRARLTPGASKQKQAAAAAGAGQDGWLSFSYELAIGDEPVSPAEWQRLVAAKTPLVRFRGAWVELDPAQMARVQALVEEGLTRPMALSALELLRVAAEEETGDVALAPAAAAWLQGLSEPRSLAPVPTPSTVQATLREYQARGLAWLAFLDGLGLNGCLADDMGLGKTLQVIARLAHEREGQAAVGPTLLVAPTSVVGNWQKEVARFAPTLRVLVHHGGLRAGEAAAFEAQALAHDLIVTSYALVRRDLALFQQVGWHRLVLDEAQNIKNPQAAQTRALCKLQARHRLALTGTPVENRLLDLWSLFEFLNPGYLGKEAAFRKAFETPIQRDGDAGRAALLRKLTGPLILRRVKTDPAISRDLPEKVEQKLYCPLTPEQASLYEAVVKEAEEAVDAAKGIQRKGLMLATLMKLKQVCNHPAQLLQDGSAFDPERSHKLARLSEHAREILQGGESLLVFTQFAELGGQLEKHLRQALGAPVSFLHGGTSREARERMITQFQDPASPPAIFVLSLKAGGVGITLTRANHVFHFDRWWNPAVEEQATDRAFRLGQQRNVFVHKFVTLGTLEERIDAMLEDKRRVAASVIGADESWLATLDTDTFKALIALDRSAVAR